MASDSTVNVVMPSDLDQVSKLTRTILAEIDRHHYPEHARFAIRLALDEALSNAVRHGNCGDPEKVVKVSYSVTHERFKITIIDEGCGFTLDQVPDPTCEENLRKPCGRGVMLIKAYMTEVEYNAAGNKVTMIKVRDCKKPQR